MIKKFYLLFLILLTIFFLNQSVFAKGIGTTMFQVLQIPLTAYDAALANTTTFGEGSAIANPSIIPFLNTSLTLSHAIYIEETKYSVGSLNIKLNETSGLNISVSYFDLGSMDRTIEVSDGYISNGSFSSNDKIVSVSYGRKLFKSFYSGFSLKYISQSIDDVSYDGYALGLSGLFFITNNVFISFGANNVGPSVKDYSLPSNLFIGCSGEVNEITTLALQIDQYYNDDFCEVKIATERKIDENFLVRLGYILPSKNYSGTNNSFVTNLTLGLGFKANFICIDYAWLPKGDLGNVHMFSLRVNF